MSEKKNASGLPPQAQVTYLSVAKKEDSMEPVPTKTEKGQGRALFGTRRKPMLKTQKTESAYGAAHQY